MPVHRIASGRQAVSVQRQRLLVSLHHLNRPYLSIPAQPPAPPSTLPILSTSLFSTSSDNPITLLRWRTLGCLVDWISPSLRHVRRLRLLQFKIIVVFSLRVSIVVTIISLVAVECCARSLVSNIWGWRSVLWVIISLIMSLRRLAVWNPSCSVHRRSSAHTSASIVVASRKHQKGWWIENRDTYENKKARRRMATMIMTSATHRPQESQLE